MSFHSFHTKQMTLSLSLYIYAYVVLEQAFWIFLVCLHFVAETKQMTTQGTTLPPLRRKNKPLQLYVPTIHTISCLNVCVLIVFSFVNAFCSVCVLTCLDASTSRFGITAGALKTSLDDLAFQSLPAPALALCFPGVLSQNFGLCDERYPLHDTGNKRNLVFELCNLPQETRRHKMA